MISLISSSHHVVVVRPQWYARLLCPWGSPGKNTGVSCHFLLQGIFPIQGSNPGLPDCRRILYQLGQQGSPVFTNQELKCLNFPTYEAQFVYIWRLEDLLFSFPQPHPRDHPLCWIQHPAWQSRSETLLNL